MNSRTLKIVLAAFAALLPLVAIGFLAVDASASATTRLEGVYVPRHADGGPDAGEEMHYLQTENGTFELDFDGLRAPKPGARIVVHGHAASATDFDVTGVRTLAAPQVVTTGTVNALLITVRWGTSVPTATPAQGHSFIFGTESTSTASWLRDASFGKLVFKGAATPVLAISDPGACVDANRADPWLDTVSARADAAAEAAGYNLASYPVRIINTPMASICGTGGWGGADGYTWLANGLQAGNAYHRYIVAHEVGHNFGLAHSHGLECGASTVTNACMGTSSSKIEYGDRLDTMGSSHYLGGQAMYNARQMALVGWLPRAAQTVSTSGTYTISPLEHSNPAYAPALTINTSNRSYTVELRQPIGLDAFLGSFAGVLVHMRSDVPCTSWCNGSLLLDMTPGSRTGDSGKDDFADAALAVGRAFTGLDGAFTLKVLSVGANGASVQVTFGGGAVADTAAPAMSSVRYSVARGRQATSTTVPVQFTWSATDNVGVTAFEVEWSGNNGASWVKDTAVAATDTSMIRSLPTGTTHRYRVRARDAAGNWSAFSYSVAATPSITDDKAYTLAGAWGRYNLTDAIGGTYAAADVSGSWFQFTFTGRAAALIAPKFSNAGRATIYCDGVRQETIDLASQTTLVRQVVSACHFTQSGQHTLKVVVQGTSGRPWVGVDAFAALG